MAETKWRKVKCSRCGSLRNTNPGAYEARLQKFGGSVEKMEAEWVYRECKCKENPKVDGEKVAPSSRKERQKKVNDLVRKTIVAQIPEAQPVTEE